MALVATLAISAQGTHVREVSVQQDQLMLSTVHRSIQTAQGVYVLRVLGNVVETQLEVSNFVW